jgi:hypothetical protein
VEELCKYKQKVIFSDNIPIYSCYIDVWDTVFWQRLNLSSVMKGIDGKDLNLGNDSKSEEVEYANHSQERSNRTCL